MSHEIENTGCSLKVFKISGKSPLYPLSAPLETRGLLSGEFDRRAPISEIQVQQVDCLKQTFWTLWEKARVDVLREQHRNMYIIKGETDHQPRLDE